MLLKTAKSVYRHFMTDSLYRNSIYLMLSTGIMAFFGFFFWILNARIYKPEQLGIATTLISVLALLNNFSLLGFDSSLIRYLPKSSHRDEKINSAFILVIFASLLSTIVFISGLRLFAPRLIFLQANLLYILVFIIFVVSSSLNVLLESIFMAYRSSGNILLKNSILSGLKIIFPILFIVLGAYGAFVSVGLATILSTLFGFGILLIKYNYKPSIKFDKQVIKEMAVYSGGNYIAAFLSQAPALILPLIIINRLSSENAAYFYIDMTIFGVLTIISRATTQSLLAEGSYDETNIKDHFIKSVKIVSLFLIPAILLLVCFGNIILHAFGKNYATNAFLSLQLISISAIFMSITTLVRSIYRIRHQIPTLIFNNALGVIIVLGLSFLLFHNNLNEISLGWLIGQAVLALLSISILGKELFFKKSHIALTLGNIFPKLTITVLKRG